jgi:arylsulfatase
MGMRADMGDDPKNPGLKIAWKYLYTAKDTWLGSTQNLGAQGAVYNLTMDPYEKYDMLFNGAVSMRNMSTSPGKWSGEDNGWVLSLAYDVLINFDKSIIKYPNIKRFPGGDSDDLVPNLKNPANPVPALNPDKPPNAKGSGG